MKNSAWYQKLWERKLNEHSVNADVDSAWSDMQHLLDQQMPLNPLGGDTVSGALGGKSAIGKLLSWLTYVLPAATIISAAIYLANPDYPIIIKKKTTKVEPQFKPDPIKTNQMVDSSAFESQHDTVLVQTSNAALTSDTAGLQGASAASHLMNEVTTTDVEPDLKQQLVGNVVELTAAESAQLWAPIPVYIRNLEAHRAPVVKRSTTGITRQRKTKRIKVKEEKVQKIRIDRQKLKEEFRPPSSAYGIMAGVNVNKNATMYFGIYGTAKVSKRITANAALQLHTPRTFIGSYTRASYFRPDSNPAFTFTDSRKVAVLELPLTLSYQLTNKLKIIGGPVVSLPIKQSAVKLGVIDLPRDTLFNGNNVIGIIRNTKPNKVNYGFKVGAGAQLKSVGVDLTYQILSPYQFKNSLGTNKHSYNALQIGITYKLGK